MIQSGTIAGSRTGSNDTHVRPPRYFAFSRSNSRLAGLTDPLGQTLNVVPVFLQFLNDLPRGGRVTAGWAEGADKAQIDKFPGNPLRFNCRRSSVTKSLRGSKQE